MNTGECFCTPETQETSRHHIQLHEGEETDLSPILHQNLKLCSSSKHSLCSTCYNANVYSWNKTTVYYTTKEKKPIMYLIIKRGFLRYQRADVSNNTALQAPGGCGSLPSTGTPTSHSSQGLHWLMWHKLNIQPQELKCVEEYYNHPLYSKISYLPRKY